MAVCSWVYLDGRVCPSDAAKVPIFDRGLLFAQSAYEVTAVYGRRLVDGEAHMARLARTLAGIDLPEPMTAEELIGIHEMLIERNALQEGTIYLQVTGGDYSERDFAGLSHLRPRVFLFCDARPLITTRARDGIRAITLPDQRWKRRDMKTTQLLSQVLAYRRARDAGAETAIMIEDGLVTEAASANVWIVDASCQVRTRDLSPALLGGITRGSILDVLGAKAVEAAFDVETLRAAREVFHTSTGGLVLPVIGIDGQPVGTGQPGPVTRSLQRAYLRLIGADIQAVAPWALE